MKKLFTSSLLLGTLCLANLASAADLTVGPGGTYATIGAAITAAADGDRILVKPKALPYGETLTITKSLTILSADEGTYFDCTGTWTFNPSAAAKKLTVIGMRMQAGDIQTQINAPVGTRAKLEVLSSVVKGNFNFNANNFDLLLAADSIRGQINFRFGKIIGNYIDGSATSNVISQFGGDVASSDSVWVVGNRIRGNNTNVSWNVYLTGGEYYYYIVNNYLQLNAGTNFNSDYGMYIELSKTGAGRHTVANNSILNQQSGGNYCCSRYAMYLNNPATNTDVIGNVITGQVANASQVVIFQSGGTNNYTFAYNHLKGYTTNVTVPASATNKYSSTAVINATTGAATGAAPAGPVNAIPLTEPDYADIDLTAGDAGAYGGSYTLQNFHPFVSTTASNNQGGRVIFVRAPRSILQGGSIQVKAVGFDR